MNVATLEDRFTKGFKESEDTVISWKPNPGQQTEALSRLEFEILYGGARGGGKTDAGIIWMGEPHNNPDYSGLVLRRNFNDLSDWIQRAKKMYAPLGGQVRGSPDRIIFPSGAYIRLGHLKDEDAFEKYQGHEYQRILIEELTHIPSEELYEKLISSCRSTVDGIKAQVFCTTNPGNDGHLWVKARFVDIGPPNVPHGKHDEATGLTIWRIFIPAKVEDNPVLVEKDPKYVAWLNQLPGELKRAWRDGSWETFQVKGAYYTGEILAAQRQGRVMESLPINENNPIYTFWDLGMNDTMSIGCAQFLDGFINIVDYIEGEGSGLDHYLGLLTDKFKRFGTFYFPHDIKVREQSTGRSRLEYMQDNPILRVDDYKIAPRMDVNDGINAVRLIFPLFKFDMNRAGILFTALQMYRREFDEKGQVYRNKAKHDKYSHPADCVRTLATCYEDADNTTTNENAVEASDRRLHHKPLHSNYSSQDPWS
jgi:hypothetical protein